MAILLNNEQILEFNALTFSLTEVKFFPRILKSFQFLVFQNSMSLLSTSLSGSQLTAQIIKSNDHMLGIMGVTCWTTCHTNFQKTQTFEDLCQVGTETGARSSKL